MNEDPVICLSELTLCGPAFKSAVIGRRTGVAYYRCDRYGIHVKKGSAHTALKQCETFIFIV